MNVSGWSRGLEVSGGGQGVVSHTGLALLRHLADKTGLTGGLARALASARILVHDRGRVLADLACAIADGARVISDFRVMGPIARHLPASDRQHYAPLGYEAVDQLASLMSTVLLPSVICGDPGPLANAAWMMGKAMTRIADLVDPDKSLSRHSSVENAEDLADSLSCALGHAHGYWASIQTSPELAARALDSAVNRCDSEAVVGKVTMTLDLPNATSFTVTLDQVSYAEPGGGFTTVAADSPLLATGIDGKDHLEIRSALNMIGAVLTRHLAEDVFDD